MKILVKIKAVINPDLGVSIGLKKTYHEFDAIEDAIEWIFKNKNQIDSYEIFSIKKFSTKEQTVNSFGVNNTPVMDMHIHANTSYGEFR